MKYVLMLMLFATTSYSMNGGCFEEHLKDAIKRNQTRKSFYNNPEYSKKVRKRAKFIANSLIFAEKLSLITAKKYDRKAEYFQRNGLTILCDELIDINDIRRPLSFKEPEGDQPKSFIPSKGKILKRKIKKALKKNDLAAIIEIVNHKLDELEKRPDYNCLMRNDLRTILFIAQRAGHHEAVAKEKGIKSPMGLSLALIKKMSVALPFIDFFDKKAFPLQKEGIPIICQDFPGSRNY